MPIYVYECSACKARVEELQKASDPPPIVCAKCECQYTMKRQIGVSNFSLKDGGVGWAKNGYSG